MPVVPLAAPTLTEEEFPFVNFEVEVEVRTSFETDVSKSREGKEDRLSLRSRPSRTVTFLFTGLRQNTAREIVNWLARHARERVRVPLHSDRIRATAASSGIDITCAPAARRFFPGGLVKVGSSLRTIVSILVDEVKVNSAITVAVGDYVIPMMDCYPSLEHSGAWRTDEMYSVSATFEEIIGPSALLRRDERNVAATPLDSFGSYDVIQLKPDWSTDPLMMISMFGASNSDGRGQTVSPLARRPTLNMDQTYRFLSHSAADQLLSHLEFCRGRWLAFYVPVYASFFNATSVTTTYVDVEAQGLMTTMQNLMDNIYIEADGTIHYAQIASWVDNTTTWRLTFVTPLTTITNVKRVGPLILARLASDEIVEKWLTHEHCEVSAKFIEVLDEESVTIANAES